MNEIAKYEIYKKKLEGICNEHDLTFRFRSDTYPITLMIRPLGGIAAQMTLLENADEDGYTSPDAYILFSFADGAITYKMSQTFTIGDTLFTKIKNLFKNMHYCWLQYFFRDIIEKGALRQGMMPVIDESNAADEDDDTAPEEVGEPEELDAEDLPDIEEIGEATETPEFDADSPEVVEAIRIVRMENKASTSLLQRRMSVGYAKAAQLIDTLEALGVVGPYNGSKPREVLPCDEPVDSDEEVPCDEA